ncbi:hypothetical protein [Paraprevotella xylaniphila]|uniref:hypothetical protein n=1 Tax=Paraprevotella xylaniphila TaxID=454155 RepID=UPI0026DCD9F3|nr:hypothetical protein [Paraprevotella xylaniphila]
MKGFEIQINGGDPIVFAAEHYAFALFGVVSGEEQGRLTLMGGNLTERFTWWDGALEKGDKVRVRVVETECPSVPILVRKRSREDLQERYEKVKIELRKLGKIE